MTHLRSLAPDDTKRRIRAGLPTRDIILLPLIFVGTMIILLALGEASARLAFPQDDAAEPCAYKTSEGTRFRPGCTSHTKEWEGPWVTQHYNACGYRTEEPCSPRPPGALRVAVIGSSTARGALVNYADSFAARASAVLSRACGGLVDFQNLGTGPHDVDRLDRRMPEVLALHPAAIVMTIGPYDIAHLKDQPRSEPPVKARLNLRELVGTLRDSRLFRLMQYELYRDPAFEVRAFLTNGDAADYVRTPLSPLWQQRVWNVGELLGRIRQQTGLPILLAFVPERGQTAMAALAMRPAGTDPFVLQAALRQEAEAHGVTFLDPTPAFAAWPDLHSLFYSTDGHPREGGHAALAQVIEKALLAEPAFVHCGPQA